MRGRGIEDGADLSTCRWEQLNQHARSIPHIKQYKAIPSDTKRIHRASSKVMQSTKHKAQSTKHKAQSTKHHPPDSISAGISSLRLPSLATNDSRILDRRSCHVGWGSGLQLVGLAKALHTQHGAAQHSTAQHSTAQHSTAQHSSAQHDQTKAQPNQTKAQPNQTKAQPNPKRDQTKPKHGTARAPERGSWSPCRCQSA